MLVSITLYSINYMNTNIKGMGVLPRMGVLPHLTLPGACSVVQILSKYRNTIIMPSKVVVPGIFINLEAQTKIAADDILIIYFYLSEKIRLAFSCESSV